MLPSIRGSYLVLGIAQIHRHPPGLLLACLLAFCLLPLPLHCLLAAASASWLLPWLPPPWPPPLGCRLPGHLRLLPGAGWQLVWEAFPPLPIGNHRDPPGKKMQKKCSQTRCRCRHSAAVWPISIGSAALCVKNWPLPPKTTEKAHILSYFCIWPHKYL